MVGGVAQDDGLAEQELPGGVTLGAGVAVVAGAEPLALEGSGKVAGGRGSPTPRRGPLVGRPVVQVTGFVPWQTPAWQMSVWVHALPVVQVLAVGIGG